MPTKPVREGQAPVAIPAHTLGELTTHEGHHMGWVLASESAVVGNIVYAHDAQAQVHLVIGSDRDLDRNATYALCKVVLG